jgi:type IV secretion system protein VirB5
MRNFWVRVLGWVPALVLVLAPVAHAQWAVVDVGAINQLVQEVAVMRQTLSATQQAVNEARSQYAAMTGSYGMSALLGGQNRNYLPQSWSQLQAVIQNTGGTYGALASEVQQLVVANAVLSADELAALPSSERSRILAQRQSVALLQAETHVALSTTSARFASLQQLIEAIPHAQTQKAVLDLQARIGAEETMLENDQTKLGVLYEVARANRAAEREQVQEAAIAGIGSYASLPPLTF